MRKKRLMELKPLKVMNRHIADAKKTEENPEEPHYIETIRGVGYRFRA